MAELEGWWRSKQGDESLLAKFELAFATLQERDNCVGLSFDAFRFVLIAVAADDWLQRTNPGSGQDARREPNVHTAGRWQGTRRAEPEPEPEAELELATARRRPPPSLAAAQRHSLVRGRSTLV
eukprot:COSAG04_NODE_110_length_25928_cov_18.966782_30_plen_124_part_00